MAPHQEGPPSLMVAPRTPVTAFIKINLGLKVLIKLTSERTLMGCTRTAVTGAGRGTRIRVLELSKCRWYSA